MSRKTTISVTSDNPADSALVSAAINLFFRARGVMPRLVSERMPALMALGADEWTVNNNLHQLFTPPEGAPVVNAAVEIVDQPAPPDRIAYCGDPMCAGAGACGICR